MAQYTLELSVFIQRGKASELLGKIKAEVCVKLDLVCNCFVLNKLEINVLVVGFLFSIVPAIIADKENVFSL